MACKNNRRKRQNNANNYQSFADLSYEIEQDRAARKAIEPIFDTYQNANMCSRSLGCVNSSGYDLCCDPNGCCYRCSSDCRNKFWPHFSHPRWLLCNQLYNESNR